MATMLSLLGVTITMCWMRSYQHHSRLGVSTGFGRYTLHSSNGKLTLTTPPPRPMRGDPNAQVVFNAMSNYDVGWDTYTSAGRRVPFAAELHTISRGISNAPSP